MIQRIVGIIASLAIVAVIVFTILGSGSYKSMLPEELLQPKVEVVTSTAVMQDITEQKEACIDLVGAHANPACPGRKT